MPIVKVLSALSGSYEVEFVFLASAALSNQAPQLRLWRRELKPLVEQ